MFEYIEPVLLEIKQRVQKQPDEFPAETGEEKALWLSTTLIVIHIIQSQGLSYDQQTTTALFKALLISPDEKSRTCPDFDCLVQIHFSDDVIRK